MKLLEHNNPEFVLTSWVWLNKSDAVVEPAPASNPTLQKPSRSSFDWFRPIRRWIDCIEVRTPQAARSICKLIPAQCPFERDVKAFGRTLLHIPPLCKLNPIYDELVGLRFRALCYLADECGEDISPYC
jgi:hypothetical protein